MEKVLAQAELLNRDLIQLIESHGKVRLVVNGCAELKLFVERMIQEQGSTVSKWNITESSHAALLVKKLIFQLNAKPHPYTEDEVCHCRNISLAVVEQNIINGAHTIQSIRRTTTANTACGSCLGDVESILNYWLR